MNVVPLRQARLVPRWVTVLGRVNHIGTEPGTQVDSAWAIPLKWVLAVAAATAREERGVLHNSRPYDQDCWHTGLQLVKGACC